MTDYKFEATGSHKETSATVAVSVTADTPEDAAAAIRALGASFVVEVRIDSPEGPVDAVTVLFSEKGLTKMKPTAQTQGQE